MSAPSSKVLAIAHHLCLAPIEDLHLTDRASAEAVISALVPGSSHSDLAEGLRIAQRRLEAAVVVETAVAAALETVGSA